VEGHEQDTLGHDVGDFGFNDQLAAAGGDLDRLAGADAYLGGIGGVDFDIGVARNIHQAFNSAGHGAGVIVVQDTAGGEDHRIIGIRSLSGRTVGRGLEEGALAAAELANVQDGSAGMICGRAGPLQRTELLKTLIAHSAVGRSDSCHLGEDFVGGAEAVAVAESRHNVGQYLEVGMALADGLDSLADALDAALGIGEGAVLLSEGGTGQDNVGKLCGLGKEDILNDQQFALLQSLAYMVDIGVGHHRVLTHDVQAADAAFLDSVHYLGNGEAGLGGKGHAPCLFELGAGFVIEDLLVAREIGGQTAHVAGALNVVLAAQRVDAAAVLADLAAQECEVGSAHNAVGAGGVLGDAHCVVDAGLVSLGIHAGSLLQLLGVDAADLCDDLGGVILDDLNEFLVALGALGDILLVLQAFGDDDVHHAVEEGNVGARLYLQEYVGLAAKSDAARLGDDYLGALAVSLTDKRTDDGVSLGGVRTGDKDDVLIGGLGNGVGHCARAESDGKARNGGGVAQTCAVVDIVGADGGAHHLLEDVVVLIGAACAAETGKSIRAALGLDGLDLVGNVADSFIPRDLGKLAILADKGPLETVTVVDELVGELALDAEQALVCLAVERLSADDNVVLYKQLELAANTAVSAGGGDLLGLKSTVANLALGQKCADRADRNAVAAGNAVGVSDKLVEGSGYLCGKSAVGNADGALAVQLLTYLNAALAEYALLRVICKELVGVVDGVLVPDALEAGLFNAVLIAEILQLAVAVLGAAEAVGIVGGKKQVKDRPSGGDDLFRLGKYNVALSHGGGACGAELGVALYLNKADTAGCLGSKILQIAQSRYLDTNALGGFQYGAALLSLYLDAVYCNIQHNFLLMFPYSKR